MTNYSPRDRRIDYALLAGGALVLGVGVYLFANSKEEDDAAAFPDLWELMDPNALSRALRDGNTTTAAVQHVIDTGRAVNVQAACDLLFNATSVLNDSERDVLAACMRPTYAELFLFNSMFVAQQGLAPGAFISTFMTPGGDTEILAQITRHVLRLRHAS